MAHRRPMPLSDGGVVYCSQQILNAHLSRLDIIVFQSCASATEWRMPP